LRIDDGDTLRAQPAYLQDIFETLRFLDLPWDEGPKDVLHFTRQFSQVHRAGRYTEALEWLEKKGHLFACTCSRTDILRVSPDGSYPGTCRNKGLPMDTPGAAWRLRTKDQPITVHHWDGRTTTEKLPASVQEVVVRKKDGLPAYQLSSVVDDLFYGVDLIVRGEDLWPSTLLQLQLATLLPANPFPETAFYHHGLLRGKDGEKLSKSAGAGSVQHLRQLGWTAEAVFRHLSGWLQVEPATTWSGLAARCGC
jgi:glutamyl-tRNA synthetase